MIAVALIVTTLMLLLVTYVWFNRGEKEEGFANIGYTTKDLSINTCPTYANEIQTAIGNTDCCQGDMIDGKCNGNTFCTKSPAHGDIKTCLDAWREYFKKKGLEFCPNTMPNYYEDVLNANANKGCSLGKISTDGKTPLEMTRPKCRVYNTENENKQRPDSCYIEKLRLGIKCPSVNGVSPVPQARFNTATNTFELFYCQYPLEIDIPDKCLDKDTAYAYFTKTNPNWRTNSNLSRSIKDQLCNNYISVRNKAIQTKRRLEEERRRREFAEAQSRKWRGLFDRFKNLFNRGQKDNTRLQKQLAEEKKKNKQCKK